jgi:hypothetical protein
MTTFQGHRSRNAWNVALWINNDEPLYRLAQSCIKAGRDRRDAAALMFNTLRDLDRTKTPDGAPFTKTTILEAMRGME